MHTFVDFFATTRTKLRTEKGDPKERQDAVTLV